MAMTRETLAAFGRRLFGEVWKSDMATATGYSLMSIQRYANGDRPVPDELRVALERHCINRASDLNEAANELRAL